MFAFLLACLRSNLTGGGGGGPFTITGVNVSRNQSGTSCSSPFRVNLSLVYTGSPSGKTVQVERNWNGEGWAVIQTGVAPTAFPVTNDLPGYYSKFGTWADVVYRVTDEASSTNTATADPYGSTFTLCV